MISIVAIQEQVATVFNIAPEKLAEPINRGLGRDGRNSHSYSEPRQVAMLLAADLTQHSFKRIGFYFGRRDHSTVISGVRVAQRRLENDKDLCLKVNEIRDFLASKSLTPNDFVAKSGKPRQLAETEA